jgi:hypothetical protein
MTRTLLAVLAWLATAMLTATPALAAGKVLVSNDEWPLSDYGYQMAPDAARFALNVADFFTGGQRTGRFLVYSTNQGLTGSRLAATMVGAGHSWTIKDPATAPAEDFTQYDAVFVGQNTVSTYRLTEYVNGGGNVYVMSGTGYGVADTNWNAFLGAFGLALASKSNSLSGVTAISSPHPLFAGVQSLLFIAGNSVTVAGTYPGGEIVASAGTSGLFGVFRAITLPLEIRSSTCADDVSLRRTSSGQLSVTVYGNDDVDSDSIDLSTVRLLDVRPNTGLISGLLGTVSNVLCLDILDGHHGEQMQFDTQKLATTIWRELGSSVQDGEVVIVTLSGRLKSSAGGTAIRAHDTVILRTR